MKADHNLRIVADTNVLLVSISRSSKYHWFYQAIINKKIDLFVTNEILTEYDEIIGEKWSPEVSKAVLRTLIELSNVNFVNVYYNMILISDDPDDNKFVDCAFASNAHYIVTNDKHFNSLKDIPFPSINCCTLNEFGAILENRSSK